MSFRVYNGFKFASGMTLEDVYAWAAELRPGMVAQADEALSQAIVERAIGQMDRALVAAAGLCEPEEWKHKPLHAAWNEVEDRRKEATRDHRRAPDVDVEASVSVALHPTGIYGVIYCEVGSLRQLITQHPQVEEFLWGSDECPDEIAEETWAARGKVWNEIFAQSSTIADIGTTFSLVRSNHFTPTLSKHDILNPSWLPDFEQRVFQASLITHAAKALAPPAVSQSSNMSAVMTHLLDLKKGNIPGFEAIKAQVATILPAQPPMAWLDMPLPELIATAQQGWLHAGVPTSPNRSPSARM